MQQTAQRCFENNRGVCTQDLNVSFVRFAVRKHTHKIKTSNNQTINQNQDVK